MTEETIQAAALMTAEELVAQNHDLQQRLRAMESQASLHKLGSLLPKPSSYSGDTDVDEWLFQAYQYLYDLPLTEASRVRTAGSFLIGSAGLWWRRQHELHPTKETFPYRTWDAFSGALRNLFKPLNNVRRARDRLSTLRQTSSVQQFVKLFRSICLEIPDITDAEMMDRFIRGLKPRVRELVVTVEVASLDELMRLAERQDANLEWSRQMTPQPPAFQHRHVQPRMAPHRHPAPRPAHHGPMPMEIDAVDLAPLTPQERERLRQNGGCFRCRRIGHYASRCPMFPGNAQRQ